jgi:hypothetical protein
MDTYTLQLTISTQSHIPQAIALKEGVVGYFNGPCGNSNVSNIVRLHKALFGEDYSHRTKKNDKKMVQVHLQGIDTVYAEQ